jgi:hypothetical protein
MERQEWGMQKNHRSSWAAGTKHAGNMKVLCTAAMGPYTPLASKFSFDLQVSYQYPIQNMTLF